MSGSFSGGTEALRERFGRVTPEILEEIRTAVGAKNVLSGDEDALESYASDEAGIMFTSMPEVVVKPESTGQVSALMAVASKYRVAVTPRGAGSGLAGSAVPLGGGIVLSLEKMNRILEIDPVNRVAVVEPGVVTNELCKAVAEEGFLYAGYPMSTETSFIGGNVATNAGGGKVIRTGISVISSELLDKISVDITTRHLNTPLPCQDRAEAFLLLQIEGTSEELLEAGYEEVGTLCLENGALEVFVAESRTESAMVWNIRQNLAEAMRAFDPYCSLSGDMVVPLSAVPEMVREVRVAAKERGISVGILGHVADGNLHPIIFKPESMEPMEWAEYAEQFFDDLTKVALRLGGVGSGEHGIGYVKMPIFLHSKSAEEVEIMKGIKKAFDPQGILNPGKLLEN